MSYTHLNARERMSIFYLHQMGLTHRAIGSRLNRSHSTISRELKRNKRHIGCYCDRTAQVYTDTRKSIPRHARRYTHPALRGYVIDHLKLGWSPEIISNRLTLDFPRRRKMKISPEAIYQWVYKDAAAGGNLYTHLVRTHKKRRKQRRYGALRGQILNRVDISERPGMVAKRARYGDWEGDTLIGHRHQGRLVTHVERKSRYLLAGKAQDGTAASFNGASIALYKKVPEKFRNTLTLDNGSENTDFKHLECQLSLTVYFATPYASWERGTNENTNGLVRRFFPKGTNFLEITSAELEKAVHLLNHRPRKCLNYRTPFEVFNPVTGGALGT